MKKKLELRKGQSALLIVPTVDYNKVIVDTMKQLKGSVCYITLNKTSSALIELFQDSNISVQNILFIDGISKTVKEGVEDSDTCFYICSPGALTELSLAMREFLQHDFDYLVFDSVSSMMIYEKRGPIQKFLQNLVNKVKMTKTRAIFYALPIEEQEAVVKEVGSFVDQVLDLRKKK